jgi:virulence-associated protein VapD
MLLFKEQDMKITKDTRVSKILEEYGDIAEVMEMFGVQRVGRYSVRKLATKALTVEWAARVHRVPLEDFLDILNKSVVDIQSGD